LLVLRSEPALMADAKETVACALLSAALLAGLLANYSSGSGRQTPCRIVIVLFLFHEGYQTWCGSCGGDVHERGMNGTVLKKGEYGIHVSF